MRLASICRASLRVLLLSAVCAAGLYGAGLLSLVVHEAGHVFAARLTGGRVLNLEIGAVLRGRSHTLTYYPFVESIGYFDQYWVALGGVLSTAALGLIGSLVLVGARRRLLFMTTALLGTTFGAVGLGALRLAITGEPAEATDLFLFSHLLGLSADSFRWVVGALGAAVVGSSAGLLSISLERFARQSDDRSTSLVLFGLIPASVIAAGVFILWFFGFDWIGVVTLCLLVLSATMIAWRVARSTGGAGEQTLRAPDIVLEAVALVGIGVFSLAVVRYVVPGDDNRVRKPLPPPTEYGLRFEAYWAAKRGDSESSMTILEEALRHYRTVGVCYDLGTRYRVAGRTHDAVRLLSEACGLSPRLEPCWAQLAAAYEQDKAFSKAALAWRTAAALEQQDPDRNARERRVRLMLQRASGLESTASPRAGSELPIPDASSDR